MALDDPEIIVEADFTNPPSDPARVWEDITDRVRSASWTRTGRTAETERSQGGQISSLVLDNSDGALSLSNPSSPYVPGLGWDFFVRVSVLFDGDLYTRFTGTKNSLPKARQSFGTDKIATLTADDELISLALFPLSGLSYPAQNAGARVAAVLADVGCTIGTIDAGKPGLVFPAITFADDDTTTALSHLQQIEQDERGLLVGQPDGSIDFQDRYYRALHDDPMITIGETDGDIRYVEGDLNDSGEYVFDVVAVTPAGGTVEIAMNTAAIATRRQRRLDLSMLATSQAQARSNAYWYANRYGSPPERVGQIEILGGRDASTWPSILAAKNSDIFVWQGGGIEQQVRLERVTESWMPGRPLKVLWDLSPAERDILWQLGVHGKSELGLTTRLG